MIPRMTATEALRRVVADNPDVLTPQFVARILHADEAKVLSYLAGDQVIDEHSLYIAMECASRLGCVLHNAAVNVAERRMKRAMSIIRQDGRYLAPVTRIRTDKRLVHYFLHGELMSLKSIAGKVGIQYETLRNRVKQKCVNPGEDITPALIPARVYRKRK